MAASDEQNNNRRRLRWLARSCAFLAAVLLAWPLLPWPWTPLLLPAVSPLVAVGSAIAARSVTLVTLIALPVLLAIVLLRRWFCRWACPLGLLTECAGRVSPVPKSWCEKLPPLGRWAALATLAGAAVGYPLLLWLDPLTLFAAMFGPWRQPLAAAGFAAALGVPVVLVLSFLLPGAWCRRVCPLGATQDLVTLPQRLWRRRRSAAAEPNTAEGTPLARRSLLAMALGGASAALGILAARRVLSRPAHGQSPLRPPGAVPDPQFAGLCIRCGNCIRACPTGILRADPGEHGVAGFLAPMVCFEDDYCREDCCRCLEVCPSGAIRRLSLAEKQQAPIGLARLELELCLLYYDKECSICKQKCPYEAIEYVWNEEEYIRSPRIDPARCPGCGACAIACPGTNGWEREHSEVPVPLRRAIRIDPDR